MVPLSMDFHSLRNMIGIELMRRLEDVDVIERPFDAGWLLYGLSYLGTGNGVLIKNAYNSLEKWLVDIAGKKERDIGPICLFYFLSDNNETKEIAKENAKPILGRALKGRDGKFRVLNDPDQFFCISLANCFSKNEELINIALDKATGRISRKVVFLASIALLGGNIQKLDEVNSVDDADDIITSIWYLKKFQEEDVSPLWYKMENLLPLLQIGSGPKECKISNRNIAFLAESVSIETNKPNPNMMFDLYPLSEEIRAISSKYFKQGLYPSAVFETTKKLNELIQQKSGSNKNETDLVQSTMKKIPPTIKFNDYLNEQSGINEQMGLSLITEGIFKGFRNPKGHKPEDHHLVIMEPYECLAQLITIDFIWKRVQKAKVV